MTDCIFCKIIKGEIPCFKIYEDEKTLAFLDIANDHYGHTLVIPKNHTADIFSVSQEDLSSVMETVKKVSKHYISLGFDGVNLVNCSGKAAEQSVFHLHIHILPRKQGDNVKVYPNLTKREDDLLKVCQKLKLN